tara:strand:- start:694 stop:2163 length:1470 start_codon:yes stop_codon:yes gene_type:complete
MRQIHSFSIDLKNDSLENVKKIKKFIDEFSNNLEVKDICSQTSKILEIPDEIISKKLKQIIFTKFDFFNEQPKFNLQIKFYQIVKYFFLFLAWIFLNLIFFTKKEIKKKKIVSVILDNVEKAYVVKKFNKLLSKFDISLILTSSSFKYQTTNNFIFKNYKINLLSELLQRKKLKLLKLLLKLSFFSFKYNLEFIKIFSIIIHTSLKYNKIFNRYESKILLHDRVYHSCPIRNFLFKKKGGLKIFCFQSHLAEGTISCFSDIDTLIIFGEEKDTEKKLRLLGGKINNVLSCGSVRMEQELKDENAADKITPIDILVIGLNPAIWKGTSIQLLDAYYTQISWMNKIMDDFPDIKLVYKHHPNFKGDKKETELLKNKKFETIIKTSNGTNSYHYMLKSKLILSFGSTMILEGLSLKKSCFFLDPSNQNSTFLGDLDYLNTIRINDYQTLKKLIELILIYKNKNNNINFNNFCLSHKYVSERFFDYVSKERLI